MIGSSSRQLAAAMFLLVLGSALNHKLRTVEKIGFTFLHEAGQCPSLHGYFIDHSLDGIIRHSTPAGIEFTSSGQPVTTFPAQTRIVIYGSIYNCDFKPSQVTPFQNMLMKSLKFRVRWLLAEPREVESAVSISPKLGFWRYVLLVPSERVPLATPIDIQVSTEYGSEIGVLRRSLADDSPARVLPFERLRSPNPSKSQIRFGSGGPTR